MSESRDVAALRLLARMGAGDAGAESELYALVYDDLHALAARLMRFQRASHTLQATALVREAYLRLSRRDGDWESFRHFMWVAASAMRHVLVDHARHRSTRKAGGAVHRVELDSVALTADDSDPVVDIIDLHEALGRLAARDVTAAKLVELRYFGGLEMAEIARALGLSDRTCERLWSTTRVWLQSTLAPNG